MDRQILTFHSTQFNSRAGIPDAEACARFIYERLSKQFSMLADEPEWSDAVWFISLMAPGLVCVFVYYGHNKIEGRDSWVCDPFDQKPILTRIADWFRKDSACSVGLERVRESLTSITKEIEGASAAWYSAKEFLRIDDGE